MLQTFLSNNICVRNITCAHDGRNSIIIHNKPNTAKKEQRATGGKKTPFFFSLSLNTDKQVLYCIGSRLYAAFTNETRLEKDNKKNVYPLSHTLFFSASSFFLFLFSYALFISFCFVFVSFCASFENRWSCFYVCVCAKSNTSSIIWFLFFAYT